MTDPHLFAEKKIAPMALLQEAQHGAGHDYRVGSPHLRHSELRNKIVADIRELIGEQFSARGACHVLEIGAGHGGFTEHIAATGAEVTVTEMSRPSLELLQGQFAWNPRVRVLYDSDGETVFSDTALYNVVLCISVLHHIPDYLSFIERLIRKLDESGTFASFQDPLWYPRQSRTTMCLSQGAYYVWRLGQGNILRGLRTRTRRLRGIYDENNVADMAEYHVVRSGLDEWRIEELLRTRFAGVEQWRYWSTQSPLLHLAGTKTRLANTFGFVAREARQRT